MGTAYSIKASKEFKLAIDEVAWALRGRLSDILREGFLMYYQKYGAKIPRDSRTKIEKWLKEAPELKKGDE